VGAGGDAAGIPEGGLVMMTHHLLRGLPVHGLHRAAPPGRLVPRRCRTAINVVRDMNVSCILDGREPERAAKHEPELAAIA